jgi:hypothetical protein
LLDSSGPTFLIYARVEPDAAFPAIVARLQGEYQGIRQTLLAF